MLATVYVKNAFAQYRAGHELCAFEHIYKANSYDNQHTLQHVYLCSLACLFLLAFFFEDSVSLRGMLTTAGIEVQNLVSTTVQVSTIPPFPLSMVVGTTYVEIGLYS